MEYINRFTKKVDNRVFIVMMLCIVDYIATCYGIKEQYITEGNPVLIPFFMQSFVLAGFAKFIMTFTFLIPIVEVKEINMKLYNIATYIILMAYVAVTLLHVQWILEVI